ncbi:MAG: biotin--[acetyl-CoA-carboxylase] ligase [Bacteroidetes bacterium]|nr:biotin--[acetyl-CoA-carboxylase] ligase [Bacteroidota bacterium]
MEWLLLGVQHIALDTIDSTNARARELLRDGAGEGTVITASHQTAGRGRLDRRWIDKPNQSLLASYILEPMRSPEDWGGIPLLAGLAVLQALQSITPVNLHLKWPNDVLAGTRKIAGILVESGMLSGRPWIIAGIGVNLNQREFEGEYRLPPTSLLLESGRWCDPEELLTALSKTLSLRYTSWQTEGNGPIVEEWMRHSLMFGRSISLDDGDAARVVVAEGLTPEGALLVRSVDGREETIYAGDVSFTYEDPAENAGG